MHSRLSGFYPFRTSDTAGRQLKFSSPWWDKVSDDGAIYLIKHCHLLAHHILAKDLITKMLNINPLARISIEQVRSHRWFRRNSSMVAK